MSDETSCKRGSGTIFSGEVDRRGLLRCGAWAGAGVLWTLAGGVPLGRALGGPALAEDQGAAQTSALSFVQISDTHIGFNKPANPDPAGTLETTIAKIKALSPQPAFVIHTGDITHLSTAEQFDSAKELLKDISQPIHFVPGEHDTQDPNNPHAYLDRFGQGTKGDGWYSFDAGGVHFIALVNVVHLQPGGLGGLGVEQIAWLTDDVAHLTPSTPIVVFAHMPLWSLYPQWGWGTADADAALEPLKRFGSVTVLNGHIHQVQQHVEGNIAFYTARSTAFPQPAPGVGPAPGPLAVPPEQLPSVIGLRSVRIAKGAGPLAVTDQTLAS
jgi:3',5'-cyclic AMP phosphodiesterase CpdA